jgi:hypothetical protein
LIDTFGIIVFEATRIGTRGRDILWRPPQPASIGGSEFFQERTVLGVDLSAGIRPTYHSPGGPHRGGKPLFAPPLSAVPHEMENE